LRLEASRASRVGLSFAPITIIVILLVCQSDASVGQLGEGRVKDGFLDAVLVDMQGSKEGLVQCLSAVLRLTDVQTVAVLQ
jgi:hypothetical protein